MSQEEVNDSTDDRAGKIDLPTVVILGRPNVGKWTLFNKLTNSRRSIVGDEPGITRDQYMAARSGAGANSASLIRAASYPTKRKLYPLTSCARRARPSSKPR